MKKILKEPLVYFTILGVVLYQLMNLISPSIDLSDSKTVRVNDAQLLTFMQKQDQVFNQSLYQAKLNTLPEQQRVKLVRRFAEQEILLREAQNLGLDQNDDVFERRMIQKMKYVLDGLLSNQRAPTEQEIQTYFADNVERYRVPRKATFSHVFFKHDESKPNSSNKRAQHAIDRVNEDPEYKIKSDYFVYNKNYSEKTQSQIARHFGTDFAKVVFDNAASKQTWQGPYQSAYGHHALLLAKLSDSRIPELKEVVNRVVEDFERGRYAREHQTQIDQLVSKYTIVDANKPSQP